MTYWGPPLAALGLGLVVWELAIVALDVPEYLLPAPSGIAGSRLSPQPASARILPALICPTTAAGPEASACTWPPSSAAAAGPPPW